LAAFLAVPAGCNTQLAEQEPSCFVDLPLYDAVGSHVTSTIIRVTTHDEQLDLLTSDLTKRSLRVNGSRLYFSTQLIGKRPLDITLRDEEGRRVKKLVVLTSCRQRTSVERGERDTGADVGWTPVKGRLVGCALAGDWWIRAVPMFGGQEGPTFEGYVDLAGGWFSVDCYRGERYIIVIGRDKDPVKVFGADVLAGGRNDVGEVDLGGSCPK
jgi:hypothetical protein